MRVAYFIDSLAHGGAASSLVELLPQLSRLGLIVDIVTLDDEVGFQAEAEAAGSRILCLQGAGGRVGALMRADACVRSLRPDLVHTTQFASDIIGRIAARSVGVPVVTSLAGLDYGPSEAQGSNWATVRGLQALDAVTARLADRFHANAQHVAETMSSRLLIPIERFTVIPRGRDADKFRERDIEVGKPVRDELSLEPGQPLLLTVARHERDKGLDILVQAMAKVVQQLPEVRLAISGSDGSQTEALRRQIEDLGLHQHIYLLGPRDDLPALHCAASVFVLPSRSEGFPGAIVEAFGLQTAVIASDIPGVREVMGPEKTGLVVPAEAPVLLAEAIVETLNDPKPAKERAKLGRLRFLSNYTTERIANETKEFYESIVQAPDA